MSPKKETEIQLSQEEITQVEHLFSRYSQIANQLYQSHDQAQAEAALTDFNALSKAAQISLVKSLSKTTEQQAADVLAAINALNPNKETRKEARRALLRLESARVSPQWAAPVTKSSPVQLNIANPPRFWKGFATQTREEGEMQIFLCWEQGYDYGEARVLSFLLDFWNDGIKDAFVETGTKRRIEEHLSELRRKMTSSSHATLVPCTLAEGKRLLEEALEVNKWRNTQPADEYRTQLPIINKLIFQSTEVGEDTGTAFITPDMEEQEVTVNFIGSWSFGDFGLAYDLLSADSPVRDKLSHDEWIEQHRAWFDEAHPTRMELGFVHERTQKQNSGLWLPTSASTARATTSKELEIGWSIELLDTPLSGTIKEMPMGTAINKETGRHWFWTTFILIKERSGWRIQNIKDEGTALQSLSVEALQKRIEEYEDTMDTLIKQPDKDLQIFAEEMSWRLAQLLHFSDALISLLPLDYTINEQAYERSVLTGNPERMMVYLERLAQKFSQNKADTLRRLGATMAELAYRYGDLGLQGRRDHFLQRAEESLREALTVDDSPMGHTLLGELLMSLDRNEDALAELKLAQEKLAASQSVEQNLEASIEAGLGNVAMRMEQMEEAIQHYLRVSTINPHYPGAWFSLGFAQRLLGRLEDAEKAYLHGLQVEPNDIRLYSELTAIYANNRDYQKARTILEQGLRVNPESVHLHALLGSLLFEIGDQRGAQKHLEDAERIDPEADIVQSLRQQMTSTKKRV